jgi:hypothetical protein
VAGDLSIAAHSVRGRRLSAVAVGRVGKRLPLYSLLEPMADAPSTGGSDADTETDSASDSQSADTESDSAGDGRSADTTPADAAASDDPDLDALRREVEEKYDFDNFGPADMAEMSPDEWDAAFDAESWITGPKLLDRVEQDLRNRVAGREVFAVLERFVEDGEPRLLAYSDEGYAIVHPDGSIEGRGTVLRDVKPTVALCSMDDYDVPEPPTNFELPDPNDVPEGSGQLGNNMLQVVAGAQILAGLGMLAIFFFTDRIPDANGAINLVAPIMAVLFILTGVFLFSVVANARLSDRFRAQEYRNRLRAVGLESGEIPEFVPVQADPETGELRRQTDAERAPELDGE